ncbi:hypothetical protein MTYP_00645 [Methylophilaceae bacterium]|nr:hypothetical protein MTYP_00645 [Methylophilaceae bacterium]
MVKGLQYFLIHERSRGHYFTDLTEREEPLNIVMRDFQPQIILPSDFGEKPTSVVRITTVIESK